MPIKRATPRNFKVETVYCVAFVGMAVITESYDDQL